MAQIYLAAKQRQISFKQASQEHERDYPSHDGEQNNNALLLPADTAVEQPATTSTVRIYRYYRRGEPKPTLAAERHIQRYESPEAVQIYPADMPKNVSGFLAEAIHRDATYHAVYNADREAGQPTTEYWGVTDQNGDRFHVPLPTHYENYRERYAVLVDFAQKRAAELAPTKVPEDIAIFIE